VLLLCGTASAAPALRIPFERYRLPNGLTVILHEDHRTPHVAVNLLYGVGSADERPGRTGFAHLFEHLMFMGSKNAPEGTFDRIMEAEGGSNNASTSTDRTEYHEEGPAHLLETFLWLEADRMATLGSSLTLDQLNRQRDVVRNERRESYENQPYGRAELLVPGAMFPAGHPYSWPIIGAHADLVAASLDDVRQFFGQHYTPGNASLVIAGDFAPATARRMVERYFGWIADAARQRRYVPGSAPGVDRSTAAANGSGHDGRPPSGNVTTHHDGRPPGGNVTTRHDGRPAGGNVTTPAVPRAPRVRRMTITDRVALPRVTLLWHSPALFAPGDATCDLLASILGEGKSSRLYRDLVYRRQIAQDVTVYQESRRLSSLFRIEVTASPGHTPAELERAIDGHLATLRARLPSRREVDRARRRIEADFVRRLEPLADRAGLLNHYQFHRGDPGALQYDLERYRRLTAEDLRRTASALLRPVRRLTIVVLPGKVSEEKPGGTVPNPPGQPPSTSAGASSPAPVVPDYMARPPRIPAPRPVRLPTIRYFRLANGLEVVLVERHTLPLVSMRMTVRAGGTADPRGRDGLANLTASMLDEGAGARTALQIGEELDQIAAEYDAEVLYETTALNLSVLKSAVAPGLELFADVLLRPRLSRAEFLRVHREHLADLQQRRTEPDAVANLVFRRVVYGDNHPYGRPLEGYPATMRRLTPRDLRRFHQRWFRPENSVLVVAGDLTLPELRNLADRAFGRWRSTRRHQLLPNPSLITPRSSLVLVPFPGAPQSALRLGHPGPARSTPDYAALEAVNTILGGTFTSRLNQNLRERHGYTYGAGSGFAWQRGPGPFRIGAAVFRERTANALTECLREVKRIRRELVSDEELRKAKATLREQWVQALATNDDTVELLSRLRALGLPLTEPARHLRRLPTLTAPELRAAAARHLRPEQFTVVVVGDPSVKASLVAAGLGTPVLRDVDGSRIPASRTALKRTAKRK
jgi:zinc protease